MALAGDDREALLAELCDLFEQTRSRGLTHLVSIEGESGWGKTRLAKASTARSLPNRVTGHPQ